MTPGISFILNVQSVMLLSYDKFSPRNFVIRTIFILRSHVPIIKY